MFSRNSNVHSVKNYRTMAGVATPESLCFLRGRYALDEIVDTFGN